MSYPIIYQLKLIPFPSIQVSSSTGDIPLLPLAVSHDIQPYIISTLSRDSNSIAVTVIISNIYSGIVIIGQVKFSGIDEPTINIKSVIDIITIIISPLPFIK